MMALVGTLAYEFQVTLPVMARQGPARGRGGLRLHDRRDGRRRGGRRAAGGRRGRTGLRTLVLASGAFGAVIMLAALAPTLPVELVALALVGWASISFMATGNSTLQLAAEPSMRGRVMSLWFVAFQGSTPIGGPIDRLGDGLGGRPRGTGRGRDHVPAGGADGTAGAARHSARSHAPTARRVQWSREASVQRRLKKRNARATRARGRRAHAGARITRAQTRARVARGHLRFHDTLPA